MQASVERFHITGGPGSGKTRLAQRLVKLRPMPMHNLDGLLLAVGDRVESIEADGSISGLVGLPQWISDGVYVNWAQPFLESADVIVWLDVPWRVASYRMIARHVRLEVTRQNRFPGWKRFYSFWRWAARYYANTNEPTIDRYGVPNTRSALEAALVQFRDKLVICRTSTDIEDFVVGVIPSSRA